MNTYQTLVKIISNHPIGASYVLPTKEDIKELIYNKTGHYPRRGEFDRALDKLLKTSNHLKFGYLAGWGWFRSNTGKEFNYKYQKAIAGMNQNISALNK